MIKWPFILKRINIFFIQQDFVQKMKVLFSRLLFQSTTFPNFPSWRNLNHSGRKFVRKPNFQVCLDKNLHLSYTFPQAYNTSDAVTSDICQIWITVQMTIQTQKGLLQKDVQWHSNVIMPCLGLGCQFHPWTRFLSITLYKGPEVVVILAWPDSHENFYARNIAQ